MLVTVTSDTHVDPENLASCVEKAARFTLLWFDDTLVVVDN